MMLLTIHHAEADGRVSIEPVASVTFDPVNNLLTGIRDEPLEPLHYRSGRAYVMNASGKTVANYDLYYNRNPLKQEQQP